MASTLESKLRAETRAERQRLEREGSRIARELSRVRGFEKALNPQARPRPKRSSS